MIVQGEIFHENKELTIITNYNNGSNVGILYVFTMFRAIGDRSYHFSQGIIDSELVYSKIDTTMTPEEMSHFRTEWLEKWNPTSINTQA